MELSTAYETYAMRLYEWSLSEFKHEIDLDFPILSTVENRSVQALIALMGQFTNKEKQDLAIALVKNAHRYTLARHGMRLTDEDQIRLKDYRLKLAIHKDALFSKVDAPVRVDLSKLTPKKASQSILKSWIGLLGTDAESVGKREWVFTGQVNPDWTVKTQIGIYSGGNTGGVIIDYKHIVDRYDYDISYERPPGMTNYLSVLGIARSWDILYQDELELAETSLRLACSRFVEHLPELLQGLLYDDR